MLPDGAARIRLTQPVGRVRRLRRHPAQRLTKHRRNRGAGERVEVNIKSNHRAAGVLIDINTLYIQRVNRKDIAVRFPFRRRRAAVARFTEIGTRLNDAVWYGHQA